MQLNQHVRRKFSTLFFVCFFLLTAFWSTNVLAVDADIQVQADIREATITVGAKEPLNFGIIIPKATTTTTVTLDASAGEAVSDPGSATGEPVWTEGKSGSIKVTSSTNANLQIAYTVKGENGDPNVINTSNATLPLTAATVKDHSTPTDLRVTAGNEETINVGGKLTIPNTFADFGTYEGTITVSITYP